MVNRGIRGFVYLDMVGESLADHRLTVHARMLHAPQVGNGGVEPRCSKCRVVVNDLLGSWDSGMTGPDDHVHDPHGHTHTHTHNTQVALGASGFAGCSPASPSLKLRTSR